MTTIDKARIKTLTSALEAKSRDIRGMSEDWKVEDNGGFVISTEQHAAYLKAVADAEQIKGLIDAEKKAAGIEAFLSGTDHEPQAPGANADAVQPQMKGLAQAFMESAAYKGMMANGGRETREPFSIEGTDIVTLGALGQKDVYGLSAGTLSGLPGLGRSQQVDLVDRMVRPNRVRDLFARDTTTAAILYGVRETGFTNNARVVPQRENADGTANPTGPVFGLKPKSNVTLTTVTYPIATIAHTLDVHRNVLDDEPRLRALLDRDMVDGVKMVEDAQLLYGTGANESITGIFNTPGTQTYTAPTGEKKSRSIRRSATRAALAYFTPTGVVMHPMDWEDIELEEDDNGAYRIAVSVAVGAETRLWQMRVVATPAINEGQFLTGAFGSGAKVYDRQQVNIQVSSENRDNFERNVVTIRAEERIALEVPRPESFVEGAFAAEA